LATAGQAFRRIEAEYPGALTIQARTNTDLFDSKMVARFVRDHVASADVMIVMLHGGKASCPCFDELVKAVPEDALLYIHPSDQDDLELSAQYSFDFASDRFHEMTRFIKFGGVENWTNLLKSLLPGGDISYRPPQKMPTEALYHPRTGIAATLEEHLRQRGTTLDQLQESGVPVVGLTFHRAYYLDGNLDQMDALIQEVERQGAFPIACFFMRLPDHVLQNKISDWVAAHYFQAEGRTVIHVLLNVMAFSIRLSTPQVADVYERLNVPVLQAIPLFTTFQHWDETEQGVTPIDVSISAAQPEFDGALITVPISTYEPQKPDPLTGAALFKSVPIPERIEKLTRLAIRWARLRLKPNHEKRVAILFHNYPPSNSSLGTARGLDSFASVANILACLQAEGYQVERTYACWDDLVDELLGRVTNDRRWATPDQMAERAVATIGPERYTPWHERLTEKNRAHMVKDWGDIPGPTFVHDGQVLVNGIVNGNIYIGVQPPRGFIDQPEKIHDPYLSPAHHYLFHYRWLRDVFKADAIVHVGKHGSLEWLPGKSMALSGTCYPDLAIMDLPHIYPYIINDPNEGTQAKRRSYACIVDHMIPVMTNADQYEELAEIDNRVLEYMQTKSMNPQRLPTVERALWESVVAQNLHTDLEITKEAALGDFDGFMQKLHAYLSEVADTAIADGLHTLGEPPDGDLLIEFVTQLVRLRNGDVPSLRETVARQWGYDYDALLEKRGQPDPSGRFPTYGVALAAVHKACLELVREIVDASSEDGVTAQGTDADDGALAHVTGYIQDVVLPRLAQTTEELDAMVNALNGGHVPPGGSGAPTRGMVDILPSGRNFYSVDPYKIPAPPAWETGVALGDAMVERYRQDTGEPPDNVGIVIWAGNTMRTLGEDIAQALYLMGVKPVWDRKSGRVRGLEIIPTAECKFPRIDVTFRTSGLFRDTFPNLMEMLDEAVRMVVALDDPGEANYLRRNVLLEAQELQQRGIDPQEALREASFRVFSDPPGSYGTGVPEMIDAKTWKEQEELGEIWIAWGGYAYSEEHYGTERKQAFRRRLADVRLVVKNEESREYDMLSCDDFNAYHGGFVVAVKTASGQYPVSYSGDASDPERLKYRSIQQEAKHVFRSRVLNPKWIEGLMRHGFKGAGDLAKAVDISFHWDATTEVIDDWMYDELAARYALDARMQEWMKEVNPYALQNITERLLEAIQRDMWDASQDMRDKLQDLYFEIEGDIEEAMEQT